MRCGSAWRRRRAARQRQPAGTAARPAICSATAGAVDADGAAGAAGGAGRGLRATSRCARRCRRRRSAARLLARATGAAPLREVAPTTRPSSSATGASAASRRWCATCRPAARSWPPMRSCTTMKRRSPSSTRADGGSAAAAAAPAPAAGHRRPVRRRAVAPLPARLVPGNFLHDQLEWLASEGFALADVARAAAAAAAPLRAPGLGPPRATTCSTGCGVLVRTPLPPLGARARRASPRRCPRWSSGSGSDGLAAERDRRAVPRATC